MAYTSIQIRPDTRKRLSHLKQTSRESYDEVLSRLMDLVPEGDEEGLYADSFRIGLLNARLELKRGSGTPHHELKKRLGL